MGVVIVLIAAVWVMGLLTISWVYLFVPHGPGEQLEDSFTQGMKDALFVWCWPFTCPALPFRIVRVYLNRLARRIP